jgi:hypothetical protein
MRRLLRTNHISLLTLCRATDAVLENDADEAAQAAVTAVTQMKLACQLQLELCTAALLQLVTALCSLTAAAATTTAATVGSMHGNVSMALR